MAELGTFISQETLDASFKKKGRKQFALMVDLEYCVGCHSCTMACKAENNTPVGVDYNRVITVEEGEFTDPTKPADGMKAYFIPMPCMHCGNPACLAACPVGAITKREDGIVLINGDKCIGCRYCAWACPYGAPQYNAETEKMEKCTLCVHRVDKGLLPACVSACIARTRFFGEVGDLSEMIQKKGAKEIHLEPQAGTKPSTVYTP